MACMPSVTIALHGLMIVPCTAAVSVKIHFARLVYKGVSSEPPRTPPGYRPVSHPIVFNKLHKWISVPIPVTVYPWSCWSPTIDTQTLSVDECRWRRYGALYLCQARHKTVYIAYWQVSWLGNVYVQCGLPRIFFWCYQNTQVSLPMITPVGGRWGCLRLDALRYLHFEGLSVKW